MGVLSHRETSGASRKNRALRNRRVDRSVYELLEDRRHFAAHVGGDPTVYATIQAAVNAAAPGATISVDAGTYSELVTVSKAVTIRGAQAGVDARFNVRGNAASETILNGQTTSDGRTSAFLITASGVTIDGFTVQGTTS